MLAVLLATACLGGGLQPSAPPEQLRPALRCLVNEQRAVVGVDPLRGYGAIRPAAEAHAQDMIANDYFAHERPGWDLMTRLALTDWPGGRASEALAWGCGSLATPAATVTGLMSSAPHRELLLSPHYRRMAVAVVPWSVEDGCSDPGTWVLDLVGPF